MENNLAQNLADTNNILQAVFDSAPNGIAVMQTIYDEAGKAEDFSILLFNAYTINWIGDIDYKGKRYGDVFPMVRETGILDQFRQVADTGITANFERFYDGEGMNHWFRFTAVKQGPLLVVTTEDITADKKAEEEQQRSESRFRLMADTLPEIIWVTDAQGRAEFFNKRWETFSGKPFEPTTAAQIAAKFIHPDDAPTTMAAFTESIKTGMPMEVEQRNRSASGEWRWFLNRAVPYRNPQTGEVEAWFGIGTDIHDQKQMQQALAANESRFRALANASSDVLYRLNADWSVMYPLDGRGFLLDAQSPVTNWMEINVHPSEFELVKKTIAAAIANKSVFELEHRVVQADGTPGWTFSRAVPMLDAEGNITEWFGTASDITAKKQIEESLKESESRFRMLVEQAQVPIGMTHGREMIFEAINAPMLELLGRPGDNLLQKTVAEAVPELQGQAVMKTLCEVWDTGRPYSGLEIPATLTIDGAPVQRYYNLSYTPVASNGKMEYIIHLAVDVTEQVIARHKLEEKEKALEAALDQVQLSKEAAELGTFDMDLLKGTMHWDERCRVLFGISHKQPVSYEQDFVGGLHPDDRERITKLIDNLFVRSISNGDYDVEYRTVGQKDGIIRWVRAKGKVYFNKQDQPVRFIGSVLDITKQVTFLQQIERTVEERTRELAQANEALQRTNKELQRSNANLEEFAHAASHDLKEPIRKISFFTQQLKDQLEQQLNEKESFTFSRIENGAQRMTNLIDDLLLYSHVSQRPHEMERVDLNKKVHYVLEDLELDINEKHAVVRTASLPVVRGYARQLQQMFQNLISNALKYSRAGVPPRIDITASEVTENGKAYHLIDVTDNGIGFEQQYAEKIFQMFARLHGISAYGGTGIGLSIVKKVVEHHNGFVRVESTVGEGSSFKIYLPV